MLTRLFYLTIIVIGLASCGKSVDDKDINACLKTAYNDVYFKHLAANDEQMNRNGAHGAIKVSKEVLLEKSGNFSKEHIKYYNDLAALGVITIERGEDRVTLDDTTYTQKHSITVKGKQYLIEESPTGFLLNVFDYNTFKITKKEVEGDFVVVDFAIDKIDKTELYEVLSTDAKQVVDYNHRQMGMGKKIKITPEGLKYTTNLYDGL